MPLPANTKRLKWIGYPGHWIILKNTVSSKNWSIEGRRNKKTYGRYYDLSRKVIGKIEGDWFNKKPNGSKFWTRGAKNPFIEDFRVTKCKVKWDK